MALFICQGCGAEHTSWAGKCPNCGTSETIRLSQSSDKMLDRVIKGKFKILKKLGQGGMGAVYLAEQVGIGHKVALKFLKSEFSSDAEIARRFLNEAKSYARVAHPNAVALHDFGQDDDGNLFIAMEYCEGTDLKKVIADQGHLPMMEAIDVVMQVADVLANAHEKGVIHRDLKPENIMIRRGIRGVHAKVLDFGIARLMDAGTKLTVAGAIAGTPRYMSPEQVEGKEADSRADIYSLGICLYEMLTGVQPFDGSTITEILRKQVLEPLPPLVTNSTELDYPDLEAVVQRACAKRRDDRFPDMIAFATALSQATPTQAHLRLPSLQRTGVVARMATPLPSANVSGVAYPGAAPDAGSTDGTLVKGGGTLPPLAPIPLTSTTGQHSARTQMDVLRAPLNDRPADASAVMPPPAKSNVPMIAVISVVVIALASGVYFVSRGTDVPPTPPIVVATPEVKPTAPEAKPPQNTGVDDVAQAAIAKINLATDLDSLGRARTAWENGNLDETLTYARAVKADPDSLTAAKGYQDRVAEIRSKLEQAQSQKSRGRCDAALPLFNQVLKINGKIVEAQDGRRSCQASVVDTTMP